MCVRALVNVFLKACVRAWLNISIVCVPPAPRSAGFPRTHSIRHFSLIPLSIPQLQRRMEENSKAMTVFP